MTREPLELGARLVSLVLVRWTHVSDRAFRLLVRMALTALDEPSQVAPACVYFGGRDLLAMSLRNEGGNPQTRYRAVKRLLAELVEAGAIERAQAGRAGQNAVYRLTLDGARAIDVPRSETQTQGGPVSPPEGGRQSPPQGGPSEPVRGATEAPPRNQEEPQEELSEEEEINLRTAVTGSRAREAAEDSISLDEDKPRLRLVHPAPTRTGFGFCLTCHAAGKVTLAVDQIAGSACAHHLRQETA